MTIYFHYENLDVTLLAVSVAKQMSNRAFPNADLKKQAIRASQSTVLNIAEGCCRVGRDRNHHFRIAHGSAAETCAVLLLVDWDDVDDVRNRLRRVGLMLDRMANK